MLKKTLIRALIGFVFGIIMGDGITMLTTIGNDFVPASFSLIELCGGFPQAFIVQSILSGLYGAVTFGCISLYDIERMPLALASIVHCLIIVLLHIPNSIFLGWSQTVWDVLIMACIQVAAYFIVWLILYLVYRKQVKELNELQKHIHNKTKNYAEEDQSNEKTAT